MWTSVLDGAGMEFHFDTGPSSNCDIKCVHTHRHTHENAVPNSLILWNHIFSSDIFILINILLRVSCARHSSNRDIYSDETRQSSCPGESVSKSTVSFYSFYLVAHFCNGRAHFHPFNFALCRRFFHASLFLALIARFTSNSSFRSQVEFKL